ncbi:MAG: leucine-rich repeat protein [Ruminococcus sp.]|nr:leucine-rich repeat protein [Ruminococcus sp.]
MKRAATVLAAAMAISAAFPADRAYADDNGLTLEYTVKDKEVYITGCTGSDAILIIPAELEGMPVTSVSENAFAGNTDIAICVVPDTVKSIGARAFSACPALSTVTLGSGVAEIGDYAFTACPSLSYIDVNKNNPTYSSANGCLCENGDTLLLYAGQKEAKLDGSIKTIRKGAFFGRSDVVSAELPDSVTVIEDNAFSGCLSLTEIDVPDTVTKLGAGCFMSCTSLKRVHLGSSLTAVPDSCFYSCTALSDISIPDNITSVGSDAFYSCAAVSGIYFPASVTAFGKDSVGRRYDIRSDSSAGIADFVIRGEAGSAAEKYAKENNIAFKTGRQQKGDVNGDGYIDAVDASDVLAEYARLSSGGDSGFTETQRSCADYNGDGFTDAVDASEILAKYAALSAE